MTIPGGWGSLGLGILRGWSVPMIWGSLGRGSGIPSSWGILELGRALQGPGVSLGA